MPVGQRPHCLATLDRVLVANRRLVRIHDEFPKSTSLVEEVPTFVQLDLDFPLATSLLLIEGMAAAAAAVAVAKLILFLDQPADSIQDVWIWGRHQLSPSLVGHSRRGRTIQVRATELEPEEAGALLKKTLSGVGPVARRVLDGYFEIPVDAPLADWMREAARHPTFILEEMTDSPS